MHTTGDSVSIWLLLIAGAVVAFGAVVQGAVGYGMALIAAPILALIDPTLVPVPVLMLASAHSVLAVVRDGRHADWRGVGWAMLGRLPGIALGVLAVLTLSQRAFSLLIGLCVLAFVGLSLLVWRPQPLALPALGDQRRLDPDRGPGREPAGLLPPPGPADS